MSDKFKFSLTRPTQDVEIDEVVEENGEKTLLTHKCVLKALMGDGRDEYLNLLNERTKMKRVGKRRESSLKSVAGLAQELVSRCLFDRETDKLMGMDFVKRIPGEPLSVMQEWCADKSGLTREEYDEDDEDAEEKAIEKSRVEAKND